MHAFKMAHNDGLCVCQSGEILTNLVALIRTTSLSGKVSHTSALSTTIFLSERGKEKDREFTRNGRTRIDSNPRPLGNRSSMPTSTTLTTTTLTSTTTFRRSTTVHQISITNKNARQLQRRRQRRKTCNNTLIQTT